ncbi:MAG: 2-phosphosulfolactate phosphatase [Pirellulaceae bacterium]|nr:2-phosphosulfolactate phosphatase [Pirellulaceae bacterium]
MPHSIELFSLPADAPRTLTGKSTVAVDVLRAGTTIVTALNHGAASIRPCVDIETTRQSARQSSDALLGGERQGLLIDGFDLSNSPESYQPEIVAGRQICFTTTNGTKAIEASRTSDAILIGSFINFTAVCCRLEQLQLPISIICAGTDGDPTLEDNLFGGAICDWFAQKKKIKMNPAAHAACEMWRTAHRQRDLGVSLCETLCHTQGGKNLVKLNLAPDIEFASAIDRYSTLPIYDPNTGLIGTDVDLNSAPR